MKIRADLFVYLLKCADFLKSTSGAVMYLENGFLKTKVKMSSRIAFQAEVFTISDKTEDGFRLVIPNGHTKEGINAFISELKLLGTLNNKTDLEIIEKPGTIIYSIGKQKFEKRKYPDDMIIAETEFEFPELLKGKEPVFNNIECKILEKLDEAKRNFSKVGQAKVMLENGNTLSVYDTAMTKKLPFVFQDDPAPDFPEDFPFTFSLPHLCLLSSAYNFFQVYLPDDKTWLFNFQNTEYQTQLIYKL